MTTETGDDYSLRLVLDGLAGVALLRNVLKSDVVRAVQNLMEVLISPEREGVALTRAFNTVFYLLAQAMNADERIIGLADAWQAYLISRILDDENPWSFQAEHRGLHGVAPGVRQQAQKDLQVLQRFKALSSQFFWRLTSNVLSQSHPELADTLTPWYELSPVEDEENASTMLNLLGRGMAEQSDWAGLVDALTAHWARHGTGSFARYSVLRWQGREEGLVGIEHPDPIQLENLIGYEREKKRLITNTERFLAGVPAHDAVLYGAPGTGKSSMVKALSNTYADRGLRLIELRKEWLADLPAVIALVRGRAPRFLFFIDDLSFEEHETEYKALKVLLEGAAESRPSNVLIYATTNRINLIRENFSDRGKPTDDVNWRDTMDEKASLAARFGLRVTFAAPDQENYLRIAVELAQQRGLDLPEEELRARALRWERQHAGRSGRLARQFVDDLEAELRPR